MLEENERTVLHIQSSKRLERTDCLFNLQDKVLLRKDYAMHVDTGIVVPVVNCADEATFTTGSFEEANPRIETNKTILGDLNWYGAYRATCPFSEAYRHGGHQSFMEEPASAIMVFRYW